MVDAVGLWDFNQPGIVGGVAARVSEGRYSHTSMRLGLGAECFGVAQEVGWGSKQARRRAVAWRAGTRMGGTIGLEFERVIGKRISMWVQELSSALGGSSTGISA